jgi:hypothetical protein
MAHLMLSPKQQEIAIEDDTWALTETEKKGLVAFLRAL